MPYDSPEHKRCLQVLRELTDFASRLDPDGDESGGPDWYLAKIDPLVRSAQVARDYLAYYDAGPAAKTAEQQAADLTENMQNLGRAFAQIGHALAGAKAAFADETVRLAAVPDSPAELAADSAALWRQEIADLTDQLEQQRLHTATAYTDRARLVAVLAALFPSWRGTDPDAADWPVMYVRLPTGQVSWHTSRADLWLFNHVHPDYTRQYDGHTVGEKNIRLANFVNQAADFDNGNSPMVPPRTVRVIRLCDGPFVAPESGEYLLSRSNGYRIRPVSDAPVQCPADLFHLDKGDRIDDIRLVRYDKPAG